MGMRFNTFKVFCFFFYIFFDMVLHSKDRGGHCSADCKAQTMFVVLFSKK